MPKKIDAVTLDKIERAYLTNDTETYSSLAKRFSVGVSTLERIGKERGWGRRRDQQKARRATQLIKNTQAVAQKLENTDPQTLDESEIFSRNRLTEIIQKSLIVFDTAIEQNCDSPKALSALVMGLCRLVELHTKLNPPLTVGSIVELLIQEGIQPDEFLYLLREEWHSIPNADLKKEL